MGSIGIFEIAIIAGIALLVLGPEKFPDFAKIVARTVRDIRGYVNEAQNEISKELKPMRKEFDELSKVDPEKMVEKLIEKDDEDDGTINPEPHPDDMDIQYTPDEIDELSSEEPATEDASLYDDPYTVRYGEETSEEEPPDTPERLDG